MHCLNSLHAGYFFMLSLSSADLFQNIFFSKDPFRKRFGPCFVIQYFMSEDRAGRFTLIVFLLSCDC